MTRSADRLRHASGARRDGALSGGARLWAILLLASASLFGGCQRPPALEVVRVTSPDQVVDAVLVTRAVGATVSTPHELYLVPRGEAIAGEPSLRGDRFEELAVSWREPRFLEVRYKKGRVFAFANFWHSERVQAFEYVVELRLRPTVDGFSIN